MYVHFGGFESTQIFGTGQDILGTTKHIEHWREDLTRLLNAGITSLRYSIPWHRIEPEPGHFDWSWVDGPLTFMRDSGMHPVLDPLHHTSFPHWLTDGFLNPSFPALYERFLDRLSRRHPWARDYTVFNEPLPTTLFCSYTGMWYPHRASDREFVCMALRVAEAICRGTECLRRNVAAHFTHVETGEHHSALDKRSVDWVHFANARRFLITDLILGRVTRDHELYPYLIANGATDRVLDAFTARPACIDILGLDYYLHSEMAWRWSAEKHRPDPVAVVPVPLGFASVAEHYVERYRLPIMLSETNIVGTVHERIAWLKLMESECEELVLSGFDFRGFCWYPSIDSTDWLHACTRLTGTLDRQGIWSLHAETFERIDTELSALYSELARGRIVSAQMPDYPFGPELQHRLRGYIDARDVA